MATTIVSNTTGATFKNSPQKIGEPPHYLESYAGQGLQFDGISDYMENNDFNRYSGDFPDAADRTKFTIAVWIKTTASGGYILDAGGRTATGHISFLLSSGGLRVSKCLGWI